MRLAVMFPLLALFGPTLGDARPAVAADRDKKAASGGKVTGRANFIDRLIEASWKSADVKPAKQATDEEFLRQPIWTSLVASPPSRRPGPS